MSLAATLLAGVAFGLALAAPPGPMNAIIASETVHRGWKSGVFAGLGAMSADVLFFLLALFGMVAVVRSVPALRTVMFLVGGLLMLYFAVGAVRGARTRGRSGFGSGRPPERRGFSKAFLLSLTNPYQILFWLTAGVGLLTPGTVDVLAYATDALAGRLVVETGHPALVVGLFAGVAGWVVGFPAALSAAESRTAALAPAVAYGSAAVLAGFGCYFLAEALLL
jgi:threonine/homoserine/homoserine lactone efflux protein